MANDYCNKTDIENAYGPTNVSVWADLNNKGATTGATEIAARIAWSISAAADEFDDQMRQTHYKIPLRNAAGTIPNTVRLLNAKLAGVLMFESRGVKKVIDQQPVHELMWARQEYEREVRAILTGNRRLDAV